MPSTTSSSPLPDGYTLDTSPPSVSEYRHIRGSSGLTQVTHAQAEGAMKGSWYTCVVRHRPTTTTSSNTSTGPGEAVAMGRIVSDGGWYFVISDMATLPSHQRRGLGGHILRHLVSYIKANAPEGTPYISLSADPPGRKLYVANGFIDSMEWDELGMVYEYQTKKKAVTE